MRKGVIFICALALAGCVTTQPYVDALHRFGESGRQIQKHLKPVADPSEEALYSSFDSAVTEALNAK